MPVIGRAYYHRIDVLVRQQFVIVRITECAVIRIAGLLGVMFIHKLLAFRDAVGIQIAHRHNSCLVVLQN